MISSTSSVFPSRLASAACAEAESERGRGETELVEDGASAQLGWASPCSSGLACGRCGKFSACCGPSVSDGCAYADISK